MTLIFNYVKPWHMYRLSHWLTYSQIKVIEGGAQGHIQSQQIVFQGHYKF